MSIQSILVLMVVLLIGMAVQSKYPSLAGPLFAKIGLTA